jgi:hypothetical protein
VGILMKKSTVVGFFHSGEFGIAKFSNPANYFYI